MLGPLKRIASVEGISACNVPSFILESKQPLILKGFIKDWPIVKKGQESETSLQNYHCFLSHFIR